MIENATASIYIPVIGKNSEGTVTKTWGYKALPTPIDPAVTMRIDVQPNALSQAELLQWGLSNRSADVKKVFFEYETRMAINNRLAVVTDYDGGSTIYYEIKGVNQWPFHGEAILVPVQGE